MTAKNKAQLMRESRVRRANQGLVEYRVWCTPKQRLLHEALQTDALKPKTK